MVYIVAGNNRGPRGLQGPAGDRNAYVGLLAGDDLDTKRETKAYRAQSQTVAMQIVNSPTNQPFVCLADTTTGGLTSQLVIELYNSGVPHMFYRVTGSIGTTPYPFGAWVDITAGGGGGEPSALPEGWNSGAANALLVQDYSRRRGGRKPTGGKAVVAFRADHGLANFASKMLPVCQTRGIVPSIALNSRNWSYPENTGVDAAMVDGWVAAGDVEIWNHGATHGNATSIADLKLEIVTGLAELRAQLPSAQIDGWVVPGVQATDPYMGFNNGTTAQAFYESMAGRLILEHHAVSTGYISGTHQMVLDGQVRQGGHQFTIDSQTLAAFQSEVDAAIANGTGLQVMLHPSQLDLEGKITTATFTAMIDYVVTKRDAGQLLTMSPYDMHLADASQ